MGSSTICDQSNIWNENIDKFYFKFWYLKYSLEKHLLTAYFVENAINKYNNREGIIPAIKYPFSKGMAFQW